MDAKCLKPILRTCCAIVHKEAVTFLLLKKKKRQVCSQQVVPVSLSVPKKQLSLSCSQNFIESRIFFSGGRGEECKSVKDWSDHQVKTRMVRDESVSLKN